MNRREFLRMIGLGCLVAVLPKSRPRPLRKPVAPLTIVTKKRKKNPFCDSTLEISQHGEPWTKIPEQHTYHSISPMPRNDSQGYVPYSTPWPYRSLDLRGLQSPSTVSHILDELCRYKAKYGISPAELVVTEAQHEAIKWYSIATRETLSKPTAIAGIPIRVEEST